MDGGAIFARRLAREGTDWQDADTSEAANEKQRDDEKADAAENARQLLNPDGWQLLAPAARGRHFGKLCAMVEGTKAVRKELGR